MQEKQKRDLEDRRFIHFKCRQSSKSAIRRDVCLEACLNEAHKMQIVKSWWFKKKSRPSGNVLAVKTLFLGGEKETQYKLKPPDFAGWRGPMIIGSKTFTSVWQCVFLELWYTCVRRALCVCQCFRWRRRLMASSLGDVWHVWVVGDAKTQTTKNNPINHV